MSEAAAVRTETIMPAQVDSETAEQFIAEKHIGERIKRLRLKKSMGLVELGRHTGLSASFLSQLETGRGYMVPDRLMDPYFAEFVPIKKGQDIRPHVHAGYEFLYVLQGELEIRHGDLVSQMECGDAVYFDASTPHAYLCAGKTPAVALIVTMHQPPAATPTMQLRPLGASIPGRTLNGSPLRASAATPAR
jgi:mannose-6-phosphate isomerase-like protein (cupin superfamily)